MQPDSLLHNSCSTSLSTQDGAYADVTVKAGPIKLLHKEFDVCDEA